MSIILLLTGHLARVTEGYTTPSHVSTMYIWRKGERNGVHTHPYSSQIINGPHLDVTRLSTTFCAKTVTGNQVLETRKKRGIDKNPVMHNPHTYILRKVHWERCLFCIYVRRVDSSQTHSWYRWKLSMFQFEGRIYFPNNKLTIH